MHVENFKIFSDLVESESFSRAAKLNGITQSAVSQQLRAMEKHFILIMIAAKSNFDSHVKDKNSTNLPKKSSTSMKS